MTTTLNAAPMVRQVNQQADKRLGKLAELANKTGRMIYDRAKLAAELLADREWVDAAHAGDEGQAADWLTSHYFSDLGGLISVEALAGMYRQIAEGKWVEYRFDLRRLLIEWRELNRPRQKAGTRAEDEAPKANHYKRQLEQVEQECIGLLADAKREKQVSATAMSRVEALEKRARELEVENAMLKGRIAELERLVGSRA